MAKTYPSTILQEAARAAGAPARCLWEIPGPKDTKIAWLTCYALGKSIVIVQTYKDSDGWEALTPCGENDIETTLADVFNRCKVPTPA